MGVELNNFEEFEGIQVLDQDDVEQVSGGAFPLWFVMIMAAGGTTGLMGDVWNGTGSGSGAKSNVSLGDQRSKNRKGASTGGGLRRGR